MTFENISEYIILCKKYLIADIMNFWSGWVMMSNEFPKAFDKTCHLKISLKYIARGMNFDEISLFGVVA